MSLELTSGAIDSVDEATRIELRSDPSEPPDDPVEDATEIVLTPPPPGTPPYPHSTAPQHLDGHLTAFISGVSPEAPGLDLEDATTEELLATARSILDRYAVHEIASKDQTGSAGSLTPGRILANTFIIRTQLAAGGMGEIYRVRHRDLKTDHAIKILRPEYRHDNKIAQMFEEEARLMLRVRHDAVVGCNALLRDNDGRQMILMELVEGQSLSQRLRKAPLGPGDLLRLIERIGDGLRALHQAGIVHQDLSPDNILLPDNDLARAKIIDFGVARNMRVPGAEIGIDFAGKYSFAAPEQIGLHGSKVSAASDIYALGLTLLAAARGEKQPMGQTNDEAAAARQSIPALDRVPDRLRPILSRMLEPDPRRRIASVDRLLAEARQAAALGHTQAALGLRQRLPVWLGGRRR
jgi:serine/threonine protein kinase